MCALKWDTVKTIDENEEVEDMSSDSDIEVEYQPKKHKTKGDSHFDDEFKFLSAPSDYNHDTWDDLQKYIKRNNITNKTDEKIEKSRRYVKSFLPDVTSEEHEEYNIESDGDSLSEDELKKDGLRDRQKLVGKKNKKRKLETSEDKNEIAIEDDGTFFEDAPPYEENASFYQMNISRPLMKAISVLNYVHPTPIQAAAIPVGLLGRDICGCAATGTGKTAAYMLPILERLLYRPKGFTPITRVLVLVPTRELGVQVYQVTKQLAQFTTVEVGLSVGGLELKVQESILRKNPDIVIATPGRLLDHLQNTPSFSLSDLEVLVLDEADRMLDENFADQMKEIINMCAQTRQTMLFSATMTDAVNDLASVSLNKPVKIFVDNNTDVAFNLRQEFVRLRQGKEQDRDATLAALVCRTFRDHTMIFVRTKADAHRVKILLGLFGLKVGELHGNLSQPQRLEALRKFKDEEIDLLIATDVAARGLDIRGVKAVINYTMPPTVEHYIHRVGRTARAGRSGVSVSIASEIDRKVLKEIIKKAKNPVKHRVIPIEILDKYKDRVDSLRNEVKCIMHEEYEERQINRTEVLAEKTEKMAQTSISNLVKKKEENKREWFQSQKDRQAANKRAREAFSAKIEKNIKKKNKEGDLNDIEEIESAKKLQKVANIQARSAKNKMKPKKMKAVPDAGQNKFNSKSKNASKQKSNSVFDSQFTDVSKSGAKKYRYEANQAKRKLSSKGHQTFKKEKSFVKKRKTKF
ncbi:probable ATP-dependent RNA helicase DDX27 [Daktulosphaira vitifoliae]|uniref:probable ATP-dependent RNA helicase DDX27 n=1 Tax=Daktulosphaira vitifoliae TaxID=58002 RepID=UPI0021AAAFC6|nr:probable ATP-dependent RNA helicase DDX27 [Daktulosphaira vitifoliae]XP_050522036.1 probable ATP-dependent RNA helicase DDX27 [Daktulosphaira vitifoliae]